MTSLADRLLDVLERDVVPLTREAVKSGNKIFGAAILRKQDLSLVVAGTNLEIDCPLWHGEIATIKKLYEMPRQDRPPTGDCLFLSTHEPCSMCLSAIAWAGYDHVYYLFGYHDTRDAFQIPHDLTILDEIFRCEGGDYARRNAYFVSHDIMDLIEESPEPARKALMEKVDNLRHVYHGLSRSYQSKRKAGEIPLP